MAGGAFLPNELASGITGLRNEPDPPPGGGVLRNEPKWLGTLSRSPVVLIQQAFRRGRRIFRDWQGKLP
jgi:hypothetical protein